MPEGQHHRVNCRIKSTLFQKPLPSTHSDITGFHGSSVPNTQMNCHIIRTNPINCSSIDSVAYLNVIQQQKYRHRPCPVHLSYGHSIHTQAIESPSLSSNLNGQQDSCAWLILPGFRADSLGSPKSASLRLHTCDTQLVRARIFPGIERYPFMEQKYPCPISPPAIF